MPLRRRLELLMTHRQRIQLCFVVLDVALRAGRSAPSRRSLMRKRLQTHPLQKVVRLVLRLESLGRWVCEPVVPPRVRTRGSAAVPRAARGATRRGGGRSG